MSKTLSYFKSYAAMPLAMCTILALGLLRSAAYGEEVKVGTVLKVLPSVAALDDPMRNLALGDPLYLGESILAADGSAELVLVDGTRVVLAPHSSFHVDALVFDKHPGAGRLAITIEAGTVRFSTGAMPSNAYYIKTKFGDVSVHGTVVDFSEGGRIVAVEQGRATVTNSSGASVDVGAGQYTSATVSASGAISFSQASSTTGQLLSGILASIRELASATAAEPSQVARAPGVIISGSAFLQTLSPPALNTSENPSQTGASPH
jgi:hypothetical protein